MASHELLPGVSPHRSRPAVVCDSRRTILRARRLALVRDLAQLLLVAAIDWFFATVPSTHVPWLDRSQSIIVVVAFNVLVGAHVMLARSLPQWQARRIASTWGLAERRRLRLG